MDRLPPQDAREAIHWEAEQHVPYDINDVALDFEILRNDVGPTQMQVLLVAAKRDLISAHADLIREAGLRARRHRRALLRRAERGRAELRVPPRPRWWP